MQAVWSFGLFAAFAFLNPLAVASGSACSDWGKSGGVVVAIMIRSLAPAGLRRDSGIGLLAAVLLFFLVVAAGMGAYWYIVSVKQKEPDAKTAAPTQSTAPTLRFFMIKDMVVNLVPEEDDEGEVRYMQVELAIMTRHQQTFNALEMGRPMVRSALFDLLSGQRHSRVVDRKARRALLEEALVAVRKLKVGIDPQNVEAVLLTSLVVQ